MRTTDEIVMRAPPERCFRFGADVERWPEWLPHYRWVRFQRKDGFGTGRVEMGIPYTIQASPRFTSTDADAVYLQRGGIPTGVISIPNRYMHSPNEIVALDDVDATVRLIAAFCRGLDAQTHFIPG